MTAHELLHDTVRRLDRVHLENYVANYEAGRMRGYDREVNPWDCAASCMVTAWPRAYRGSSAAGCRPRAIEVLFEGWHVHYDVTGSLGPDYATRATAIYEAVVERLAALDAAKVEAAAV